MGKKLVAVKFKYSGSTEENHGKKNCWCPARECYSEELPLEQFSRFVSISIVVIQTVAAQHTTNSDSGDCR